MSDDVQSGIQNKTLTLGDALQQGAGAFDMRTQRDAWQAMAQARIRPVPESASSRWPWQRSAA